jgi:peptide/nickel transport system permease protein
MKAFRLAAICLLATAAISGLAAGWLAPHHYATQYRDHPSEPPSGEYLLGTDELGRDRFSRLLYATRVSILLSPAAAFLATVLAAVIGIGSGYYGRWLDSSSSVVMDLALSLPWLFALLTLRSLLPLNASPALSLTATFFLLAGVGWAFAARVVRASVVGIRQSGAVMHARAYGSSPWRLLRVHVLPAIRPVLAAQFWILVPVFLLSEANLGMLGLGVSEPVPSWGNMLSELQSYDRIAEAPWLLAPAILLVIVIASMHLVISGTRTWE